MDILNIPILLKQLFNTCPRKKIVMSSKAQWPTGISVPTTRIDILIHVPVIFANYRDFDPDFVAKLGFEIAVVQQTRTRDWTFEGVADPNRPPVPAVQPRPYFVQFWLNNAKSPKHVQKQYVWCSTCSQSSLINRWRLNGNKYHEQSYNKTAICLWARYSGLLNSFIKFISCIAALRTTIVANQRA